MTRPRAPSPSTWLGCVALAGVYVAIGLLFRSPALRPISDGLTWPPVGLALLKAFRSSPVAMSISTLAEGRYVEVNEAEIRFLPDPGLRNVRADPSGLEQVLMNLCVNARDAMPEGGTLTIATGNVDLVDPLPAGEDALPPGHYVYLRVADTGVGIDALTKSQMFEPFFTTRETGRGTGLGLAVVYGVVRQSGGAISVDSAPGQGSVFTVYLPETHEPLGETAELAKPAPARGSETLLLVDDNPVREVIAQYLRAEGYTVVTADNGLDAQDLVRGGPLPIDMLLTDG